MSDAMSTNLPPDGPPDATRLEAFVRERLGPADGGTFAVELVPLGYSNLTYRVRSGDRDLILRRPPVGANVKSGHDMGREFRVLSALFPVYPSVPRPLVYCDDPAVFGAPFYLMERVEGVVLRQPLPGGVTLTPEVMRGVSQTFAANMVAIHALDIAAEPLAALGHPEGYLKRQVTGWIERYARAKTDEIPQIARVEAWLVERMPAQRYATLIHNDFKYDNLMFDAHDLTRLRAVLDWEMSTLGDPLSDLGTTLAYWMDADDPPERLAHTLTERFTTLPGNFTRAELVARYAALSGRDTSDIVYYFVYGLYKNAVIGQQIHARYVRGLLPDLRFSRLLPSIQAAVATAARVIEVNRIDQLG